MALGNRFRSWDNVKVFEASGYEGLVSVRSKVPGGPCYYDVTAEEALRLAPGMPGGYNITEASPVDDIVIQGEVTYLPGGLHLFCSFEKDHMRGALKRAGRYYNRLTAKTVLCHTVDYNSLCDIVELLNEYEDHVVEFTTYSRCVGVLPHRRTVIWEVRRY